MKKILLIISVLTTVFILSINVLATSFSHSAKHGLKSDETITVNENSNNSLSSKPLSWYCKHMKSSARPNMGSEFLFINELGGYYIGKDEPKIYLTFDAGYENGNIEKILDVLKEKDVPGAFFILENLAVSNSELVKRMSDEGHLVCNHTATHKDITSMKNIDALSAELNRLNDICMEKCGVKVANYFRPPEGKFSEQSLEFINKLGYKTILWSFAYADWDNNKQPSPSASINKILESTHNGEVILLHPTSATNAEILPALIDAWRDKGYSFGTLDELCGGGDSLNEES